MKIILKQLDLLNFKGIRDLSVSFDEHVQNIHGANETGKSTLFNAFLWLLFGKDMEGRKDYEIKTTDDQGNELHKLDHQVAGIFEVDGSSITLRRLYKEKWAKPRGAAETELDGHTTEFFWNDVPCREKDYQEKINGIMKEDVFKLLTNPFYFNTGLSGYKIPDWQARRNVLLDLAGKIDDQEIAAGDPRFEGLLQELKGKTLEEYRKQLAAQKKKVRENLDMIPARIDEATRAIPDALDFESIGRQILAKEQEIALVDKEHSDVSIVQKHRNEQKLDFQNKLYQHDSRIQIIESEIRSQFNQEKIARESKIRELRANGRTKDSELDVLNKDRQRMESQRDNLVSRMEHLKKEWFACDEKKPDPPKDDCQCPACGQDLPADKLNEKKETYEKYVSDFNTNKVKRLTEITKEGQDLKVQVEGLVKSLTGNETAVKDLTEEMAILRKEIAELEAESIQKNLEAEKTIADQIEGNEERKGILIAKSHLSEQIIALEKEAPDNSELKTRRHVLFCDLDALKKLLNIKDQIQSGQDRVDELKKDEANFSQQIVEMEGIEFTIQEFIRAKINTLEDRINHKFKYARFKLFDLQVNGQEVECCETTYKGVVYGTLNTAARVLVGIDIINTLSAHYGVSAPIFLDNRESVTSIPDTPAQIINLIVSPADKQLRVA